MSAIRRVMLGFLLGAAMLSACSSAASSAREHVVFAVRTGFGQGMTAHPIDVIDMGLPDLYNISDQAVRLSHVSLVGAPSAVHLRSVTAYVYPAAGGLGIGRGNFLRRCRKQDKPYPVTAAVTRPHAYANWLIVMAFSIVKPGRYHLGRAKIYYTTAGRRGWQYQNLNTTVVINAGPPGTKPWFDGCL